MSGKLKFQISRLLDERIKRIINGSNDLDTEFAQLSSAYIIGFKYGNVTNYVGLTTNYRLPHVILPVVGLVFFKSSPNDEEVKTTLSSFIEYSSSVDEIGNFETDLNEHLFLIYSVDTESNGVDKRIFDISTNNFLVEQPKFSVLDETKIYNHSALSKLNFNLKLNIQDNKLSLNREELEQLFNFNATDFTLHLNNSSFSTSSGIENKNLTETLYDYLDVPNEVLQAGDYLPQLTKSDKVKLGEKWRNKMKAQRAPLELTLEHDKFSYYEDESLPDGYYGLHLEFYLYLQANDPISKTFQVILCLIGEQLGLLRYRLSNRNEPLEVGEIKPATFKTFGHLIYTLYPISSVATPNYGYLAALRRELHQFYIVPRDRPHFRYSQRITNLIMSTSDELAGNLCNVHTTILDNSGVKGGAKAVIDGKYTYHHYMQGRINDNGWGCAYRSLQTIISWFKHQGYIYSPDVQLRGPKDNDKTSLLRDKLDKESRVPTHEEIQSVLVDVGDKAPTFIGSQKWIGSQEVCYVLNHLYDLESKFISVSSGNELVYKARELGLHFSTQSTPVMIGGGVLAHTIIGIDFNEKNGDTSYLILDPHYTGSEDLATITKKGWCGWKKNTFWDKNAFYNLCLPQRPNEF